MLFLGLAAVALQPADRAPPRAAVEARATVRIVRASRIRFEEVTDADGARMRLSTVQVDGALRPAKLVEFE